MFHIRWIMAYGMSGPRASWRSADSRGGQRVLCRRYPLGGVVDGLQLGMGATSTPEPGLRIVLKNTTAKVQEVPIGFQDHDLFYNVQITARAPRGEELAVFDLNTLRYHVTSCCGPSPEKTVWLEPGGVQEFTYALSQLFCFGDLNIPLSKFLKQGYTVRAAFQFRDTAVVSP